MSQPRKQTLSLIGAYWHRSVVFFVLMVSVFMLAACGGGGGGSKDNNNTLPGSGVSLSSPDGLTATPGNAQVSLTWNPVSGATSYNLYFSTSPGTAANGQVISGITGTSYTHTGLTNSTTYYYVVRAVGTGGVESDPSSEVSATPFVPEVPTHTLTVSLTGTGTGSVTSTPSGINCGSTCSASFDESQQVTLTALEGSNSTFAGWSGACSGTTCTVTMSQARNVTATFNTASSTGGLIMGRYQPMGSQDEIIRDVVTGLEWQRCSVGQTWNPGNQSCDGDATTHTWDEAIELTAPGGFRIPTIEELRTIVYCSNTGNFDSNGNNSNCGSGYDRPTIVLEAFPNTSRRVVWSGSPGGSSYAWSVYFYVGYVFSTPRSAVSQVRLVRVGQ